MGGSRPAPSALPVSRGPAARRRVPGEPGGIYFLTAAEQPEPGASFAPLAGLRPPSRARLWSRCKCLSFPSPPGRIFSFFPCEPLGASPAVRRRPAAALLARGKSIPGGTGPAALLPGARDPSPPAGQGAAGRGGGEQADRALSSSPGGVPRLCAAELSPGVAGIAACLATGRGAYPALPLHGLAASARRRRVPQPRTPLAAATGPSRQALPEPLAVAKLSHFPLGRAGQGLFKLTGARCK